VLGSVSPKSSERTEESKDRRHNGLWTAPAERNDDGALDRLLDGWGGNAGRLMGAAICIIESGVALRLRSPKRCARCALCVAGWRSFWQRAGQSARTPIIQRIVMLRLLANSRPDSFDMAVRER